jgi:hypothetical protein
LICYKISCVFIINSNILYLKNKQLKMKKTVIPFLIAIAIFSITSTASAQESATATATATIVTPISITKTVDMNFGNVAVQSTTAGTVVLSPAGVRTATGGVTLPSTVGTVTAATFTVNGQGVYTYTITLPGTDVTLSDGASHTMTVNTFTSNPSATGTLTAGTQTLKVGATLNVGAAQAAGVYVSGTPFTVTVNYN